MNKKEKIIKEMDDFIKEIGGLENGFFTNRKPYMNSIFMCIGIGWYPLVKELISDILELGWDKQICQIKEKFGGLRFYINSAPREVHDRISKAETDSFYICEFCGNPGELRTNRSWIKTLCDSCNNDQDPDYSAGR